MHRNRNVVSDRAVGSVFVIVSTVAQQAIASQSAERGQASNFSRASASASMNPLSVDFPGPEKSKVTGDRGLAI